MTLSIITQVYAANILILEGEEEGVYPFQNPQIQRPLNPAKGYEVGFVNTLEPVAFYSLYKNAVHTVDMKTRLSFTISNYTHRQDYGNLCEGICRHNVDQGMQYDNNFSFVLPSARVEGGLLGYSAICGISNLDHLNPYVFAELEKALAQRGATRLYVLLNDRLMPNYPKDVIDDNLYGYHYVQDDRRTYNTCIMKYLEKSEGTTPPDVVFSKMESIFPEIRPCFGVFVRNEDGHVLGGTWGEFMEYKGFSYADIHLFFMGASLRGKGLGSRIMALTEDYVRERGVKTIVLGTMDRQAPWFYDSHGFERISVFPQFNPASDGTFLNNYTYMKTLQG